MQNRTPVARSDRPDLPDFAPVPRKYRHDGWTPERQKAFIEALADTGCVSRAAAMVNMAQANCYTLRRAPGAEEFRRAWGAALDFGLQRLKDIAFERAIEGYQVPVFSAGKLMGYRRKTNDALLMFCLRHYGHDAEGRRTTIAYYSAAAMAGVGASAVAGSGGGTGEGAAVAQASATVRTVTRGRARGAGTGTGGALEADSTDADASSGAARQDALAGTLRDFGGVTLDATAAAAIDDAIAACAARRREADAVIAAGGDDAIAQKLADNRPGLVKVGWLDEQHWGQFESPCPRGEADAFGDAAYFDDDPGADGSGMDPRFIHELPWPLLGEDVAEAPGVVAQDRPGHRLGDALGEDGDG